MSSLEGYLKVLGKGRFRGGMKKRFFVFEGDNLVPYESAERIKRKRPIYVPGCTVTDAQDEVKTSFCLRLDTGEGSTHYLVAADITQFQIWLTKLQTFSLEHESEPDGGFVQYRTSSSDDWLIRWAAISDEYLVMWKDREDWSSGAQSELVVPLFSANVEQYERQAIAIDITSQGDVFASHYLFLHSPSSALKWMKGFAKVIKNIGISPVEEGASSHSVALPSKKSLAQSDFKTPIPTMAFDASQQPRWKQAEPLKPSLTDAEKEMAAMNADGDFLRPQDFMHEDTIPSLPPPPAARLVSAPAAAGSRSLPGMLTSKRGTGVLDETERENAVSWAFGALSSLPGKLFQSEENGEHQKNRNSRNINHAGRLGAHGGSGPPSIRSSINQKPSPAVMAAMHGPQGRAGDDAVGYANDLEHASITESNVHAMASRQEDEEGMLSSMFGRMSSLVPRSSTGQVASQNQTSVPNEDPKQAGVQNSLLNWITSSFSNRE